jgi:hypothetical protein
MATQTTIKTEPIVEKLISISKVLETESSKINASYKEQVNKLQESHGSKLNELNVSKVKEISETLSVDNSETGKAMKNLLLQIGKNHSFETYEPLGHRGLWELERVKLVTQHVNPTSLWAGVDTYETDPTRYALTPLGKNVYDKLSINGIIREDAKE